jgi:23S rRNA pseudouridine1911/1915/1917 synthase
MNIESTAIKMFCLKIISQFITLVKQKGFYLCGMSNSTNYQVHIVEHVKSGTLLFDYCRQHIPSLRSRSVVNKAIIEGRLKVNGEFATFETVLQKGDKIELYSSQAPKAGPFGLPIDIVYEDHHLMVVNKPGGLAVNGIRNKTLENALSRMVRQSPLPDALPHPIANHRIDVPTKGLVLLAKTKSALIALNKAFQDRQVEKAYFAVVHGQLDGEGTIDSPVQDKRAITKYESLRTVPSRNFGHLSLLRLTPVTGRTHQLRIHLQGIGHLVVGEREYARGQATILGKGLFLCSCRLAFQHPATGEMMDIEIPEPKRFKRLLDREEQRYR